MRKATTVGVLVSLSVCVMVARVFGWGTLAHCVMALKAGSAAGPGYHNSPDFFPSKHAGWDLIGVTNEFCWTHEVQRTSTGSMPFHFVAMPTYYANPWQEVDNSASEHMGILLAGKLLQPRRTQSMQSLRVGWAAHNREDQAGPALCKAHFSLFPGPLVPEQTDTWYWHGVYEIYCDHLVFVFVCWLEYTGNYDAALAAAFDAVGWGTTLPPPYDTILGASTGDSASDGLICLAMKAFRKKQQTVDTVPACYGGMDVKSRAQVANSRTQEVDLSLPGLINKLDKSTFYRAISWAFYNPTYIDYWNVALEAAGAN